MGLDVRGKMNGRRDPRLFQDIPARGGLEDEDHFTRAMKTEMEKQERIAPEVKWFKEGEIVDYSTGHGGSDTEVEQGESQSRWFRNQIADRLDGWWRQKFSSDFTISFLI